MRSPKDWELMAQKKDIEEIKTILYESIKARDDTLKKGISSLIISIISSFAATFLTAWISNDGTVIPWWGYVGVVFLVVVVSVLPFVKDIYRKMCRKETHDDEDIVNQVNSFDNDIIYNIMLANRYFDLCQSDGIPYNEKEFYLSETKYFIRKTVHQISSIKPFSVCNTMEECNYGKKKRILRGRIESSLNFVLFILGKLKDDSFENLIETEIDGVIISLGLNNDNVKRNLDAKKVEEADDKAVDINQ